MEVHAHSHTPRKKWNHYFWEFLMLFLAVFCGFLAEYQLEHIIEHQREKQYMQSLFEDLHLDTADLNKSQALAQYQQNIIDSITTIIDQGVFGEARIEQLYLLHFSSRIVRPNFENRTSAQLKNSGGMRLVQKKNVRDAIIRYWEIAATCERVSDYYLDDVRNTTNVAVKIFKARYIIRNSEPLSPPLGVRPGADFISNDLTLLEEYNNRQIIRINRLNTLTSRMNHASSLANELMDMLKKEY